MKAADAARRAGSCGGPRRRRRAAFAAMAVLLACGLVYGLRAGETEQRRPSTFCRLAVSGTPRECGVAHGRAFAGQIGELVEMAALLRGRSRDGLRRMVRPFEQHVQAHHREEMRGIAQGSGTSYDDILALNCWYELEMTRFACRQVVALGSATASGGLIHGRNLDWLDYGGRLSAGLVVLDVAPEGRSRMTLLVWPGMVGCLTGTNGRGLSLAANQLGLRVREGEPVFLLMRRALEGAGDLDDALDLIRAAPVTVDVTMVLSDARGDRAACVEWLAGRREVRWPQEGILVADNSPHAGQGATPQTSTPLWQLAARQAGSITPASVQGLLRHPAVLLPLNLYSCVLLPGEARMLLAAGSVPAATACRYEPVPLFGDAQVPAAAGAGAP